MKNTATSTDDGPTSTNDCLTNTDDDGLTSIDDGLTSINTNKLAEDYCAEDPEDHHSAYSTEDANEIEEIHDDVLESCIIGTAEFCEVEFTLEAAQSMEDEVQ